VDGGAGALKMLKNRGKELGYQGVDAGSSGGGDGEHGTSFQHGDAEARRGRCKQGSPRAARSLTRERAANTRSWRAGGPCVCRSSPGQAPAVGRRATT